MRVKGLQKVLGWAWRPRCQGWAWVGRPATAPTPHPGDKPSLVLGTPGVSALQRTRHVALAPRVPSPPPHAGATGGTGGSGRAEGGGVGGEGGVAEHLSPRRAEFGIDGGLDRGPGRGRVGWAPHGQGREARGGIGQLPLRRHGTGQLGIRSRRPSSPPPLPPRQPFDAHPTPERSRQALESDRAAAAASPCPPSMWAIRYGPRIWTISMELPNGSRIKNRGR